MNLFFRFNCVLPKRKTWGAIIWHSIIKVHDMEISRTELTLAVVAPQFYMDRLSTWISFINPKLLEEGNYLPPERSESSMEEQIENALPIKEGDGIAESSNPS